MVIEKIRPNIDTHFPKVEHVVATKIIGYVDRNNKFLDTANIAYKPLFNDADRDVIYSAIQMDEDEIEVILKQSKTFDTDRKVSGNPFYVACVGVASHCLNRKKPAYDVAQLVLTYMSVMMYSSLHYKYVEFSANENAMAYTINHLDESFLLKKLGSIYRVIDDNTATCIATYQSSIKRGEDDDIQKFIAAVWTRLNAKIKNIFKKYYDTKNSGAYLNHDVEQMSEEGYREVSNDTFAISQLSGKVYTNLISGKVNNNFIKLACLKSGISEGTARNVIEDIIKQDDEKMRRFIDAIIEFFIYYNHNTIDMIGRGIFIDELASGYASNTASPQMARIKSTLDEWLEEHGSKYGRARYGKTAAAGYKKAIFMFFVFTINSYAK